MFCLVDGKSTLKFNKEKLVTANFSQTHSNQNTFKRKKPQNGSYIVKQKFFSKWCL